MSALLDRRLSRLETYLSPQRLRHSMGVMETMGALVDVYGLDREPAITAGLLHDIAKELPVERQIALVREAGIAIRRPCERHPMYLHGPVSAYLARVEFGVSDAAVLDAIHTHATYSPDPFPPATSLLEWGLRLADLAEPGREFSGLHKLRALTFSGRLWEAALLQSQWIIEHFEAIGIAVHPYLLQTRNAISAELGISDDFFARQ